MIRTRRITSAVTAIAVLTGSAALGTAALTATTASAATPSGSTSGFTFTFPTAPSFPSFPTPPTFPSFPPATPAPPPTDTSTNGTTSIVSELAPGSENNDGAFDINEFDYHITALLVQNVLAADPHGPVSILADGTRPATFFQPDDEEWVLLARKLSGQSLPLPAASSEQATYAYFTGLGTARLEKILSYLIIPGQTLTGALLGPVSVSQATYTTANGQTLLVKSDFGVVTLVDNSPLTKNSGIVEAPMNQGNRQIAWSTAVLLPSSF
jgi:hypothetical protein